MFSNVTGTSERTVEDIVQEETIEQHNAKVLENLRESGTSVVVNLDNNTLVQGSRYYATSMDGTLSYIHYDEDLYEYVAAKRDPDRLIEFASKALFEAFCEKFPNEQDAWCMQLKLNKNDYSVTIGYVIDYIQRNLTTGMKLAD